MIGLSLPSLYQHSLLMRIDEFDDRGSCQFNYATYVFPYVLLSARIGNRYLEGSDELGKQKKRKKEKEKERTHSGVETLITGGPMAGAVDASSRWAVPHSLNQPAATITLSLPLTVPTVLPDLPFICLLRASN